jgi:hypothetical protein
MFEVFVDGDGILNVNLLKSPDDPQDAESVIRIAEMVTGDILSIFQSHSGEKYNVLIDNSPIKEYGSNPKLARMLYFQIAKHQQIGTVIPEGDLPA